MTKYFVAVLMGSDNDYSVMRSCVEQLKAIDVPFEIHVLSAHRTPEKTVSYVKSAEERGACVFIAAAGMAAHLAGTIAAHTVKPVIGVPVSAGTLGGLDALLSTVQMPGGVPVATMGIGEAGAKNAALLAAQILSFVEPVLADKLLSIRLENQKKLAEKDRAINAMWAEGREEKN